MKEKCREVAPVFNRCVVFNTDATSYHGHPDPLTTPEGVYRRSLALYYYTASEEIYNEVPNTSTMYQARPDDDQGTRAKLGTCASISISGNGYPQRCNATCLRCDAG